MKNINISLLTLIAVTVLPSFAYAKPELTEQQKVGYTIGYKMAEDNRDAITDLDLKSFHLGFRAGYLQKESLLSETEMNQVLQDYSDKRDEEFRKELEAKGKENLATAEAFLTENKHKDGVITTESGLQYKVIKEGLGGKPSETDTVTVHYEGTLLDGMVFDSSIQRGKSVDFALNQVIEGWAEGLQLMNKGSEYQLFIHPDLAYGEFGPAGIGSNSLLIFTVELIDFEESK